MLLVYLIFLAAIGLESLGTYISIAGLSYNSSPIIIILIIILDFSKIVIASSLYKKWNLIHFSLKIIFIPTLISLMLITSVGAYAFLIKEFQKTVKNHSVSTLNISLLEKEKTTLEQRKLVIDTQISNLPSDSVSQRKRLTSLFDNELSKINNRLDELNKTLPAEKKKLLQDENISNGNLYVLAEAFNTSTDTIFKYLAFIIVLLVDPLAIALLTLANSLHSFYTPENKHNQTSTFPDNKNSSKQQPPPVLKFP